MAATDLNRDTIKDAIVTRLKTNSTLYDATGASGKVRTVLTGRPEDEMNDRAMPYIFVKNSPGTFERLSLQDIAVSDGARLVEHELFFDIVCAVNEKTSRAAENKLDDFQQEIMKTLQDDQNIGDSVDTSDPIRVADYPMPTVTTGKQGRVVTLRCLKVTN